jgi:hypothetical protein
MSIFPQNSLRFRTINTYLFVSQPESVLLRPSPFFHLKKFTELAKASFGKIFPPFMGLVNGWAFCTFIFKV